MDKKMGETLCPDCRHKVVLHDMFGCVMMSCTWRSNGPCTLSQEFLLEYLNTEQETATDGD
jgi:hypothetical protein